MSCALKHHYQQAMYLLQVLQTQRVQRIIHIHIHIIIVLVYFEVFLPHPHLHLDENDVSCCCCYSLVMDTLWQGVLSYNSCSNDALINPYFYFETSSLKFYGYIY